MLLERIQLKNLLSFGPESEEIELRPLNVLIGPNGSGKSNFIEAIGVLHAAPTDLAAPMSTGRGVADWIWQGDPKAGSAHIQAVVRSSNQRSFRYSVEFAERHQRLAVINERLAFDSDDPPYFEVSEGARVAQLRPDSAAGTTPRQYMVRDNRSVLAQVKGDYAELACLAQDLERISLYRDWIFGRANAVRSLENTDHPSAKLAEDHANLGLVLYRLSRNNNVHKRMVEALRVLYQDVSDFRVEFELNTVHVFVQEQNGNVMIPATRLSDGTIRYLSLLAILCDPDPPPLVCIEEPELGFHPDILPSLAELLLEASERCQVVVTTHSEVLVDALTKQPECIVVCEKENGRTKLKRLSQSELKHWLDNYRLGDLWSSGEIGGNRW